MKIKQLIPTPDGRLKIHQRDTGHTVVRTVVALAVIEREDGHDHVEMMVVVDGGLTPSRFGHFPEIDGNYLLTTVELDGADVNTWHQD